MNRDSSTATSDTPKGVAIEVGGATLLYADDKYLRPGEYDHGANIGGWYDSACYWRKRAEEAESRMQSADRRGLPLEEFEKHLRGEPSAINQCDGCQRGLPMRTSDFGAGTWIHYDDASGVPVMACTADRYKLASTVEATEAEQNSGFAKAYVHIPDIIRRSTWKTPELRESAAKLVQVIIEECK